MLAAKLNREAHSGFLRMINKGSPQNCGNGSYLNMLSAAEFSAIYLLDLISLWLNTQNVVYIIITPKFQPMFLNAEISAKAENQMYGGCPKLDTPLCVLCIGLHTRNSDM